MSLNIKAKIWDLEQNYFGFISIRMRTFIMNTIPEGLYDILCACAHKPFQVLNFCEEIKVF